MTDWRSSSSSSKLVAILPTLTAVTPSFVQLWPCAADIGVRFTGNPYWRISLGGRHPEGGAGAPRSLRPAGVHLRRIADFRDSPAHRRPLCRRVSKQRLDYPHSSLKYKPARSMIHQDFEYIGSRCRHSLFILSFAGTYRAK